MWKPCVCCQFCRVVHLHIVSFTEDFFVHASKTLGEFSGNRSQHSAFQKWRSENHVFFWLLAHCRSVSFRKWMKRLVWLYFFISIYIYIHQIYASPSVLGSDRDSAVPLTFFSRHVLIVCRFFWGRVLYRLSQRISLNWNFLNFQNSTLPARLSLAAERGHLQVVQELLAKQANLQWRGGWRATELGTMLILFRLGPLWGLMIVAIARWVSWV